MPAPTTEVLTEPDHAVSAPLPLASAEMAECTCPDWCERDHDRD